MAIFNKISIPCTILRFLKQPSNQLIWQARAEKNAKFSLGFSSKIKSPQQTTWCAMDGPIKIHVRFVMALWKLDNTFVCYALSPRWFGIRFPPGRTSRSSRATHQMTMLASLSGGRRQLRGCRPIGGRTSTEWPSTSCGICGKSETTVFSTTSTRWHDR